MSEPITTTLKDQIKLMLKRAYLQFTGKVTHLKKRVTCPHVWYGDKHAGFFVNPDQLNEKSVIYSFGIGQNISFDSTIIKNHDSQVFAFDPTPKSLKWLTNQNLPSRFQYFGYGIAETSGFVDFYLPKNPDYVSGSLVAQNNVNTEERVSVEMKSIGDIVDELGHRHIDILKMDIEGAEYKVIDAILEHKISISQILIEFHDRYVDKGVEKSKKAIENLRAKGFEIFAVSDTYEEVSLIHTEVSEN